MIFNSKIAIGVVALAGMGIPFYFFLSDNKCSFTRTNVLQKVSLLNTSETILECSGGGKSYSVYLVPKDSLGLNGQDLSLKVVDNSATQKVKWGPESDPADKWDDWAIAIYKEGSEGKNQTEIRAPNRKTFRSDSTIIPCQKSKLKFKDKVETCPGGSFIRNSKLTFEVDMRGNVQMKSDKFEWIVGFSPQRIFCLP